ncbi:type II toxin-antitoxin system VapC family toxin [Taklimakanibacter deserti]|uniref:type II toxin-antitoxin system VapC family toxin n=1 Tax=Taklimakanibacter deserti TaxID=2267839 RepID=UPI000E64E273
MIILDTNVLSEMLRPDPEPRVRQWLNDQPRAAVFTTTITRGEIYYGIRVLPAGKRRDRLWNAAIKILDMEMAGQVLAFDSLAADEFAEISATKRTSGRPIAQFDAQIAGITRSRGAQLATRNVSDFHACGFDVINPWGK